MSRLTTEQLLKELQTHDPNSITKLSLDHKALSDVSCLAELKNLERLDLGFNTLTSLEGLRGCVNLKWLSVVQNKLVSLKGIEGLTRLTVLNSGKNKLRSMDGVQSLSSLRALILNDNEIVSICNLDQLKELNTVVLSRNPICEIGDSLVNMKSITKLSLSHCQIQKIDSSFMSCIELKELRLVHNDITTLPQELAHNKKLQNLDLGNNLISRWSDLKVLESLVNLKNLNLHGNPISESDKLLKKVRRLLPRLQIFNGKPIDRSVKNEKIEAFDEPSSNGADKLKVHEENKDEKKEKRKGGDDDDQSGRAQKHDDDGVIEKKRKTDKTKKERREPSDDKLSKNEVPDEQSKISERKSKKKGTELDALDDKEISFQELFSAEVDGGVSGHNQNSRRPVAVPNSFDGIVINHKEKKKPRKQSRKEVQLAPEIEVGMGGTSTWV